jgi:hypothetical protein
MENGMLVELRERGTRRDCILFTLQAAAITLLILMTTVSCATFGFDERSPSFSLPFFDAPNEQSGQQGAGQPKVQRVQLKNSTSPKIAKVNAPKTKKTNTPARVDAQEEQQLYQEFLQWQKSRKDQP